jgi:hypothetical protein
VGKLCILKMVRLVGGVIVSEIESDVGSSSSQGSSPFPSTLTSNITLFGSFTVPLWTLALPVLAGFMLGGAPGGMITTSVLGVGYCLSDSGNSNLSQVRHFLAASRSLDQFLTSQRNPRPQRKANVKSISDYPKPVKC